MAAPVVLFTRDVIAERVRELGREITAAYNGTSGSLVLMPILDGAMPFAADLMREIKLNVLLAPVRVKTYEGQGAVRRPRVQFPVDVRKAVHERHLLIVDDIWDKGHTLNRVIEHALKHNVRSIQYCVLLDKVGAKDRLTLPIEKGWVGFDCPNKFVVGYGLDGDGGLERNLPFVGVHE